MSWFQEWLYSQNKYQLAEHALVIAGTLYAVNKLKDVKLNQVLSVIPGAQGMVQRELEKEVDKAVAEMFPAAENADMIKEFPVQGIDKEELLSMMTRLKLKDADGHSGKSFAYIYDANQEAHNEFVEKAFQMFIHENALNPVSFPTLRRFEVEVVNMTKNMLNGDEDTVGTMTSGGTESILCAIKAYRDRARKLTPHITEPEMVLPESAHVAHEKAAHYFGVKTVYVPVDPTTFQADMGKYAAAITPNTICLVGSAPQYPQGVVDPIEEMGQLALEHDIPLHVDACIGGFMLPWVEKLGYPVPRWDFRVPGVTSISADIHKYGFCPKGASTLTFRNSEYRKYQFFSFSTWPGGLFVSPSMLGSRPGGAIAAAWASLASLGVEGFVEIARQTMATAIKFREGIAQIDGLKILGTPHMTIVSLTSTRKDLHILALADVMEDRYGWKIERQHRPHCLHLSVMPPHAKVADKFLENLRECVDVVIADPSLVKKGSAAMYGNAGSIPDNAILEDFLTTFLDRVYQ